MVKLKIITGYVPIIGHPRSAEEYGALGERFRELPNILIHPFYSQYADCWLGRHLKTLKYSVTHSIGDNPQKNSEAYHVVQHQKFVWVASASIIDRVTDVFVWIDYGIFHVPGVTAKVILDFLDRVKEDDLAIPGCWQKSDPARFPIEDQWPNWRFCGGVMVVPRSQAFPLFHAVRADVQKHLDVTHNLSWEVNTLARVEAAYPSLPLRWYQADHNETMFTGY